MASADPGSDDAIPLFVPADDRSALPQPRRGAPSAAGPLEPEGERFDQLQALFPGRIIEVVRPAPVAGDTGIGTGSGEDGAADGFDQAGGYANLNDNDSIDEPRYDTAAEAAAEETT